MNLPGGGAPGQGVVSPLQTAGEDAPPEPIEPNHLHQLLPAVDEEIEMTVERVPREPSDVARQCIEGAAHVDRLQGHEDPGVRRYAQHAATTSSSLARTSASK